MPEENVNGFAWRIGWSPWLTIIGMMFIGLVIGAVIDAIAPLAGVGLLAGIAIYFYGTRVVNSNYEDLLDKFVSQTERSAARGIDVANSTTYTLTRGNGSSPIFVQASKIYTTTTLVVTGTSVNVNSGAEYQMVSRNAAKGGSNRELFYDQITAVESHQDGNYSTLEIRTSGGESIEVGSGLTDTVDAAISEIRKRLRDVKSGRNSSIGQSVEQQSQQSAQPQAATESDVSEQTKPDETTSSDARENETSETNTGGRASSKAACTNCQERIDIEASFCPSCGTESPFDSGGSRADASRPSDTEDEDSISTAVVEVADDIQRRLNPDSSSSKQLCETLSDEDASENEVQSALENVVEELEKVEAVQNAIKPADRRSTVRVYENIKDDLEQIDGELSHAVRPLVSRLLDSKDELADIESTSSKLTTDVQTICNYASESGGISFQSRDTADNAAELAKLCEQGQITITETTVSVGEVAETIQRESKPSSGLSRELLDVLHGPTDESIVSSTLRDCIDVLDDHWETSEMLSEIEVQDVTRRLDSLNRELRDHDTTVHSQLANRVRELEAMLDKPETVDDLQLYAIYQEISFYDRTLLPQLSRASASGHSDDSRQLLDDVERRIGAIEDEYISVRADHNHSIPRHFLGLAESMSTDARDELDRHPDRAAGILIATDSLLDNIEALYQQNEYSVMLRRLRG